jgi:UDP-N-acetylmuramate--alanine ligase
MKVTNPRDGQALPKAPGGWQALLAVPPDARAGVRIHLVGIGGSGLSAIAILLMESGFQVTGSDQMANEATDDLAQRGARVFIGHDAGHAAGANLLLISSAVPPANPEVRAAQAAGIPVVKRAELLGQLTSTAQSVGVAGTHGKTTTTAMLALVLWQAGQDPSFVVGGRLAEFGLAGSAARAGHGPFVIEADEYDRMFLGLQLGMAVVTNVEWDHVDCYPSAEAFGAAFEQFVGKLAPAGKLLLCADDPRALALRRAAREDVSVQTYGLGGVGEWQACELETNASGGLNAKLVYRGQTVGRMSLSVPGEHNVSNALAAIAAATWFGVAPDHAAAILSHFRGAGRRFEVLGEANGVTIVDDYGHHPTEIRATLAAARRRYAGRRIWAVYQPHTYSRYSALLDQFAHSFGDADQTLVLDIYAAREPATEGVHSSQLVALMNSPTAHYVGSIEAGIAYLLPRVARGDLVITLSAGDGNRVGQVLLAELRANERTQPEHTGQSASAGAPVEAFLAAARKLGAQATTGEALARHTTFRIGGPADLFAAVNDPDLMVQLAVLATAHGIPCTVLGGGSNVLVSDAGLRGLVIVNQCREIRTVPGEQPQLVADAGVALAGLARWAIREGLAGLEWAVSVPGTVGGAIVGNAGAHGGQIADNLAWVQVAGLDGSRRKVPAAELRLSYRTSVFKEHLAMGKPIPLILAAGFQLERGDAVQMAAKAGAFLAHRRATQPVEPSVGSVFSNPPGDHAGRLIEAAGLKGYRIGGAQVSLRHANFIVNTGSACAADVVALMSLIQERVDGQFRVKLIPEILMLGQHKP